MRKNQTISIAAVIAAIKESRDSFIHADQDTIRHVAMCIGQSIAASDSTVYEQFLKDCEV